MVRFYQISLSLNKLEPNHNEMKKITGMILLAAIATSCSLFQKPSMTQEQIDAMKAENQALKSQLEESKDLEDQLAMARMQVDEAMLKLADCQEAAKGRYHIIVGAFKTPSYATDYAAVIKSRGYDGKILAGPYNFNLVTSSSHESLRSALNQLDKVRADVIEDAWIYIE
jgi:cell division protein FtsN